jgi:hypothetical protein
MKTKQSLNTTAKRPSPIHKPLSRRDLLAGAAAAAASLLLPTAVIAQSSQPKFKRIPVQYIAALGDSTANSGNDAQTWGLWKLDPGPRGIYLDDYDKLLANGSVAPTNWTFNNKSWWLEEHGLIMEAPEFPLPPGLYRVTGDREVTAVLKVQASSSDGTQAWQLSDNASIYDVTHLRCRSALYTPAAGGDSCSPERAKQSDFPVKAGAEMPPVSGCNKQDYAVLIVTGFAELPV